LPIGQPWQLPGIISPLRQFLFEPFVFFNQALVLLTDLLQLSLDFIIKWAQVDRIGQGLFAGGNPLLDDISILRLGLQTQVMAVMINGRGRVGFLLIVDPAQFKVGGG